MYSDILSLVTTTREREELLNELTSLKSALFDTKAGGLDHALSTEVRKSVAEKIRAGISKAKSAEDYINGLENELKALSEIKLSLATEPSENLLGVIFNWVYQNAGEGLLIDIEVDGSILGGAKVSYNGKYFDGSLVKSIESTFRPQK